MLLAFFSLYCKPAKHVTPDPMIQWQKVLGMEDKVYPCVVRQTKEGGYIVAATHDSLDSDDVINHGDKDYWVIKLDTAGTIQWQTSFGGSGIDIVNSIQQTKDNGYIIAGKSNSNHSTVFGEKTSHGEYDYWIVKIDSIGMIQWQKSYGGSGEDLATSIQQTLDGGYIIAGGSSNSQAIVYKGRNPFIDSSIGSSIDSVTENIDGDVTGHHGSDINMDYWIVKIDSAGAIQWQKSYGGTNDDFPMCIQQTTDGDYVVAGYSYSSDGDVSGHHGSTSLADYWVAEIDSTSAIKWQKSYGGRYNDFAYSIIQATDGGFIVAGNSFSSDGDVTGHHGTDSTSDYWIVKIDSTGGVQWQKSYGGSNNDIASSIVQTDDGGYVIAGGSNSTDGDVTGNHGNYDCWIVKIDGQGQIQWQKSLGGRSLDAAYSIQQTVDKGYIMAGTTMSENGDVINFTSGIKYWIVKLKNSPDK